MDQSFRLIGSTQIRKIPVQHTDGQNVVYWECIEHVFPGVRHVKNGKVDVTVEKDSKGIRIIPSRIKHCPNTVLDVLPTTVDHGHANISAALVRMGLADATDDALSAHKAVDALQVVASPAVESVSEAKPSFQQIVKLASKKAQVFEIEQHLISSLEPALQKKVQASLLARNLSVQAHNDGRVEDSERLKNESDGCLLEMVEFMARTYKEHFPLMMAKQDEIKQLQIQNAHAMETKQDELNAKQDEIKQLQIQNAHAMKTKQDELNAKQDKIEKLQIQASADMEKMRGELMGQFSVLQCRIQAVLTQTYELHEYPIPRLFVVLPQDPSRWHSTNPFSKKFRLYFLCECGEHTKSINSQTKIPHHIHLANHEGYEIARPSEFFQQYGSHVVTVLKILKLGITVAGVAVPALPLLISTESVDKATASLQKLQEHIELGVDQSIVHIDNLLAHDGGVDEEPGKQVNKEEALEGADLRKLATFLKGNDGNKVLGNLYRTVTDKGHVKWVCSDHYDENYNKKAAEAFRRAVDLVSGSFDDNIGRVEVDLRSREQAEQFYAALEKAKSVYEIKIKLSWETTYADFKRLRDTLPRTNVAVLEFGCNDSIGPPSDFANRGQRYDPVFEIMRLPSIQSFEIMDVPKDFFKRSSLWPFTADLSNLRRLRIGAIREPGSFSDTDIVKLKLLVTLAPNLSNVSSKTEIAKDFEKSDSWPGTINILDPRPPNSNQLDSNASVANRNIVDRLALIEQRREAILLQNQEPQWYSTPANTVKQQEAFDCRQEELKQLQERALNQLVELRSRVEAAPTQTYELHEYPSPDLFIVLPQYPSGWDILEPFTDKYRLYFLCECGEYTKVPGSNSKFPHEIHLAKHEGYEIARPTEFFHQYGPYVLTILKILKYGVSIASVAVPAVAHLINADALDHAAKGFQHLKDCFEPGMDQVISKIEKDSVDRGENFENFTDQMEGADLRNLDTFLEGTDGNKVLGNLYRTVTDEGHVKWVCLDHYRETYNKKTTEAFRRAVELVAGSFDENIGRVEVDLRSREQAEQFYAALKRARSVHVLKIELSWETTYSDFKKLRDTLRQTSVAVLEFGCNDSIGPPSDFANRGRRYDPVFEIMRLPSIQSFEVVDAPRDFFKRSSPLPSNANLSNLRQLRINGIAYGGPDTSIHDEVVQQLKLVEFTDADIVKLSSLVAKARKLSSLSLEASPVQLPAVISAIAEHHTYPIEFRNLSLRILPPKSQRPAKTPLRDLTHLFEVYGTQLEMLNGDKMGLDDLHRIA